MNQIVKKIASNTGSQIARRENQLPALTRSETAEHNVSAMKEAFEKLQYASNSFDLDRVEAAIEEARCLASFDDDAGVQRFVDEVDRALIEVGQPATRAQIATCMAQLIGSFPNFAKIDARIFGMTLSEDVAAQRPTRLGLETACRRLRRTLRFVPTVAEVVQAIEIADRRIDETWDLVYRFHGQWERAQARLRKLTADRAAWEARDGQPDDEDDF